jgi:hypothetical protein
LRDSYQAVRKIALVGEGEPAPFHVEEKISLFQIASLARLFIAFLSVPIKPGHSLAYAVKHSAHPTDPTESGLRFPLVPAVSPLGNEVLLSCENKSIRIAIRKLRQASAKSFLSCLEGTLRQRNRVFQPQT